MIADGIVEKPSDLDIASILGMGFPPYRGGLIFWADLIGARYICEKLSAFAEMLPKLASFFQPCPYLQECAGRGCTLESGSQMPSHL